MFRQAQYHGGLSTKDIHYVVLRSGSRGGRSSRESDLSPLKQHLDESRIPWVHVHRSGAAPTSRPRTRASTGAC